MSKESVMAKMGGVATPSLISPVPEGAPVTPPQPVAPPEAKPLDSDRFAALAKKEAKFVREQQALKKEKEEVAKIKDLWTKFEGTRKDNPIEALKMAGFSETELFNILSGAQPKEQTPEEKAQAIAQQEIEKFKKEQSDRAVADQKARDEQTIKSFKGKISQAIKGNPDKFELIAFNGQTAEDLIYETVEQTLKETNELISIDEAAQMVEKYYEDSYKQAMTLKKLAPPPPEPPKVQPPPPTRQRSKTITNDATVTSASAATSKVETRSEKRARLEAMLRNGLTK